MELTITQIAARLGVSERTAQRWQAKGLLQATPTKRNRYQVDQQQLDELAVIEPDQITDLKSQIAALTDRIAELERITRELQPIHRSSTPKTQPARPTSTIFTEGTLPARNFAQAHGFSRDRMIGWIRAGMIDSTPVGFGREGDRVQHQLTPAQQAAAIQFWESHAIPYQRCTYCPHHV